MTDADDDFHFAQPVTLHDGTPATIRLMRPDDKDRLVTAFAKLDRQSIYTRFFSFRKELPEGALNFVDHIDLVHLAALAVILGVGADQILVGGASYIADTAPDGARMAEVAFTIEEDYQRQGLASRLLAALAGIARRHGIQRFEAEVLAMNAPMLAVFQHSGLPMTQRREGGGVIHIALDLQEA